MNIKIDNLGQPECWENAPPQKPALIEGLLRQGYNLLLTAGSKAGKSCLLTELAICLAEGKPFLDCFQCEQVRVLYMNMEISRASMLKRFRDAYKGLGIYGNNRQNIDIINMKGIPIDISGFSGLLKQVLQGQYQAVIIDPIYCLIGDENNQGEVKSLVGLINQISASGVSVVYSHHHTKGSQSDKKTADRASGSSVLARATDAILDFVEIEIPEQVIENNPGDYTAWVMESITREFDTPNPEIILYHYPVHQLATEYFEGSEIREKKQFGLFSKTRKKTSKTLEERFADAFNDEMVVPLDDLANCLKISEKSIRLYLGEGVKSKEILREKYQLVKTGNTVLVIKKSA